MSNVDYRYRYLKRNRSERTLFYFAVTHSVFFYASVNITEKVTKRIEISELEKMALQQFLSKYKNGLVATGVTATFVPIMYSFNKKALFTSQVVNIGVQLGAQAYVAGIAGPSMFSNLDKDTFAKVQAVLFPRQVFFIIFFVPLIFRNFFRQKNPIFSCSNK